MNICRNNNPPGEPLYTLDEIADRLKISRMRLGALMAHYPGFKAWRVVGSTTSAAPRHNLYRMSDARRWWATLPAKHTQPAAEVA